MELQNAWNSFEKSGTIHDYIHYKNAIKGGITTFDALGEIDQRANNNGCSRD